MFPVTIILNGRYLKKWLHTAKYNKKVVYNGEEIILQKWSSKLGMDFLTTHKDADDIECIL